jgi:hypothetical protein
MKTSWSDTQKVDEFLAGRQSPEEAVLFEARLLLEPDLRGKLKWQQEAFALIKNYSRKKLKEQINAVEQLLFRHKRHRGFRELIVSIFSK